MPGLSRDLVNHWLPIKPSFRLINNMLDVLILLCLTKKRRLNGCWTQGLFVLVDMLIGSLILCLLRRKVQVNLEFALILNLNKLLKKINILWVADMLINDASEHRVIIFFYGNAGYNQIFMAKKDKSKMTLDVQALLVYLSRL
jgi:hypothetical protein